MTETARETSIEQPAGKSLTSTFGDPEAVLSSSVITDYLGIFVDAAGDYYRPSVDFSGLVKITGANA